MSFFEIFIVAAFFVSCIIGAIIFSKMVITICKYFDEKFLSNEHKEENNNGE